MKRTFSILITMFIVGFLFNSCANKPRDERSLTDDEIVQIASEAYVYGYPLVLMDLTKQKSTNVAAPTDVATAPVNQFGHFRSTPDEMQKNVVKPNLDTYYSSAWLDLKKEPMVLSVPATDRYYLMPMLDGYTNVFASPGTRTTGTDAQDFLITGPFYEGSVPEGMTRIKSPTNMVWILGRTQVNSPEDGQEVVVKIQDQYNLEPLSKFTTDYTPPLNIVNRSILDMVPSQKVEEMPLEEFFNEMTALMVDNPPAPGDKEMVDKMAKIGLVPGEIFKLSSYSEEVQNRLQQIPENTYNKFKEANNSSDPNNLVNGWGRAYQSDLMGNYQQEYFFRGLVNYVGLGANLRQDAVYPNATLDVSGQRLQSENHYIVHFDKEELPPVNAFWSLTMYNEKNFLAANPINRFALGDRDPLQYNEDGSLDIYVQRENPGPDKESNWLPAPAEGPFELTLRLYWPKEEVLEGEWTPPPIEKVSDEEI